MSSDKRAIAIAAHPDDIEFTMAGTLLHLRNAGWEIHCLNVSTGSLGSNVLSPEETRTTRAAEARESARLMGAAWHPSMADDMEVVYTVELMRRVAAVVREVRPTVVLTHPLQDYMEDHMETGRLAVSATFARGIPNFLSTPPLPPVTGDATVYHAMPHTMRDPLGRRVVPTAWVDITGVMAEKRAALSCHNSQKEWLESTQGMGSYVQVMEDFAAELGPDAGCRFAEGWNRHHYAGFCARGADILAETLGPLYRPNPAWIE